MSFPFPYLRHGPIDADYIGKAGAVCMGFCAPVPVEDRHIIARGCPQPIAGNFC